MRHNEKREVEMKVIKFVVGDERLTNHFRENRPKVVLIAPDFGGHVRHFARFFGRKTRLRRGETLRNVHFFSNITMRMHSSLA